MSDSTKIRQLPNSTTSVKTFLGMLMEQGDSIEAIACVVQFRDDDGITRVFHTNMTAVDAAWMKYVFDKDFMRSFDKDYDGE